MRVNDPYVILGIQPGAGEEEIKKAYRKAALETHPDRNPGDEQAEARFKEVQAAYETLTNHKQVPQQDPFDFFSSVFGGHATRRSVPNLQTEVTVEFLESLHGCKKTIHVQRHNSCGECEGVGASPEGLVTCRRCQGSGQVGHNMGVFIMRTTCPECKGGGKTIKKPCDKCGGSGTKPENASIEMQIPAGILNQQEIVLRGMGNRHKHEASDLYVKVTVNPHQLFQRVGWNVTYLLPITFTQAVFGDTVEIPTPKGKQKLIIPPQTQSGQVLRIKGMGFPSGNITKGDLLVQTRIDIPDTKDEKYIGLMEELRGLENQFPSPDVKSFRELANNL